MINRGLGAVALTCVLVAGGAAHAHPHGWIDMQSQIVLDEAGRVAVLRQAWLFDELYSAFMLDEFAVNGQSVEEGLAQLARDDIAALAEFDYFTRLEVNGERRGFGAVERYENGVADDRIWLEFDLPLAAPVDPAGEVVAYAVYDPVYYIELLHVGEAPVRIEGPGSEACSVRIVEPQPTAEIASLAASLDRFTVAEDGLGSHFAQWVHLTCARR